MSARSSAHARSGSDFEARVEADFAGRPFLLYRDSDDSQQLFLFATDAASATVGRLAPSDLQLDWDGQVSRLHARFERVEDEWDLIDDAPSRNGTFLNGQRVSGRCRLKDGDTLRFGTTTVTFRSPPQREQPDSADAAQTPPDSADAAQSPAAVDLSTTQRRVLAALCRPDGAGAGLAGPATDQQMADELFLSVGAVKTHLRVLYAKLGVEQLPENEMRARLIELAFSAGLVSERDA